MLHYQLVIVQELFPKMYYLLYIAGRQCGGYMCSHFVELWIDMSECLACGCVESDVCYIVGRNAIQVP